MKLQLLFNRNNKEFIGYGANGQDALKNSNLLIKEIELDTESFNSARWVWRGNYDEGELIDLNADKAIVLETDVDFKNYDIMARKSNLDVYMCQRICQMSFEEFQQFTVLRNQILEKIRKEKEFFQSSPHHKYVPREAVRESLHKSFKIC